jgi:hypothetical protein
MLGQDLVRGSAAYFELVNNGGGIYGRRISILLKDDKYEPDPAVQNTNELIEKENAFFLFDYVGTPTLTRVLPLLKYYEKEKIVNVAPFTGADPQRKPPYDKFVFNIRASYHEEMRALVRYLYDKGYRRIGFLDHLRKRRSRPQPHQLGLFAEHSDIRPRIQHLREQSRERFAVGPDESQLGQHQHAEPLGYPFRW